jgi:hypothetical protein
MEFQKKFVGKKEMNLQILSEKPEKGSICYLCQTTLEDYLSSLPADYDQYEIQRGIEKNRYLDRLIDTVLSKGHIPPMVLVVEEENYQTANNSSNCLQIQEFKILDGLQRTYRLKIIWDTVALFQEYLKKGEEFDNESPFSLSKKYSKYLYQINSSSNLLYAIVNFHKENGLSSLLKIFKENQQWFEVWANLLVKEQVDKMLILNAGHKQVQPAHQLELLFLNLIPYLQESKQLTLFREKDETSKVFSKNRKSGQFHFSHVISAIRSFIEAKPVTTNIEQIQKLQKKQYDTEKFVDFVGYDFFEVLITFLLDLDKEVAKENNEIWLGKESTLTGIFGALGSYRQQKSIPIKTLFEKVIDKFQTTQNVLNLQEYNQAILSIDASKRNIGSLYRTAISSGFNDLLMNIDNDNYTSIHWHEHFNAKSQTKTG